jgi:hypothetical protein
MWRDNWGTSTMPHQLLMTLVERDGGIFVQMPLRITRKTGAMPRDGRSAKSPLCEFVMLARSSDAEIALKVRRCRVRGVGMDERWPEELCTATNLGSISAEGSGLGHPSDLQRSAVVYNRGVVKCSLYSKCSQM